MESDECIHLLDPASCSICKPKPERPVMRTGNIGKTARFPGTCASCGNSIYVDDPIKGEPGAWKHEGCS